jgi:L-fuculose-phosphate aldolase
MPAAADLRREMIRIGRLLYDRNLIVAAEGNLSVRLGGDRFLVTPAGACKAFLAPESLLVVDAEGRPRDDGPGPVRPAGADRPSSEWRLHREIYRCRPDAGAVCHAHPPWATAFAAAGQALDGCLLPEIVATLGRVPLTPYATPGTEEVPVAVREAVARHDAVLLSNHGVVALGATLQEAYFRLESVERLAQVTLLARLAGGERRLTAEEVRALRGEAVGAAGREGDGEPVCRVAEPVAGRGPEPSTGRAAPGRGSEMDALAARLAAEILADLGRRP